MCVFIAVIEKLKKLPILGLPLNREDRHSLIIKVEVKEALLFKILAVADAKYLQGA